MKKSLAINGIFAIFSFLVFGFLVIKSQGIDLDKHNRYISDLRLINETDARINQNIWHNSRYDKAPTSRIRTQKN